jgi:hypothetical protein
VYGYLKLFDMDANLDTTCTFSTVTTMSATPNATIATTGNTDEPNMQYVQGYRCYGPKMIQAQWSTSADEINSSQERPSWIDLHDILNMKTPCATSPRAKEVQVHVDENHNMICIDPIGPGVSTLEDHLANGVSISTSPINIERLKTSRKRQRTTTDEESDVTLREPKVSKRVSGSEDDQENNALDLFTNISQAIVHAKDGEILLADIYVHMIQNNTTYRDNMYKNWRVRVRHILSVNSCFVKGKRAKSGRGFYWMLHPACEAFKNGDINRRSAAQLVKQWQNKQAEEEKRRSDSNQTPTDSCTRSGQDHDFGSYVIPDRVARHERIYVPMTTVPLTDFDYYDLLMNLCEVREQR